MADDAQEPKPGLAIRLIANVLTFGIGFGALWPVARWATGDSKGYGADLREGLLQGAVVGVLMTFLGDPLACWLDRLLARMKGRHGPGSGEPPAG